MSPQRDEAEPVRLVGDWSRLEWLTFFALVLVMAAVFWWLPAALQPFVGRETYQSIGWGVTISYLIIAVSGAYVGWNRRLIERGQKQVPPRFELISQWSLREWLRFLLLASAAWGSLWLLALFDHSRPDFLPQNLLAFALTLHLFPLIVSPLQRVVLALDRKQS